MAADRGRDGMNVVFYGKNALAYRDGLEARCDFTPSLTVIDDDDRSPEALAAFAAADAVVGVHFDDPAIAVPKLRLFQIAAAGYNTVDFDLLPDAAAVCNCFGHDQPIAEFVLLAMLQHLHPVADGDRRLRHGDWHWSGATAGAFHDELAGKTVGLLGYGHIGQAVAVRAKPFEVEIVVANRSPVPEAPPVDRYVPLERLDDLLRESDVIVCALPLTAATEGLIDAAAFAKMKPSALLINVGRGPVIDEAALFEALRDRRIAAACIDTWYRYPSEDEPLALPSRFPFHELDNVVLSPHMSGWTHGLRRRRRQAIADNLNRLHAGQPLVNVVRPAAA
jgi:phosphoglycerate dehydrogenase-like enzyme